MLNSCDEDLILTEKQLHSINLCSEPPEDLQIPFLELRRAIDSVANVKVNNSNHSNSNRSNRSNYLHLKATIVTVTVVTTCILR